MAANRISNRHETGEVFTIAMWTVGVIALLQVAGMAWGLIKRSPDLGSPVAVSPNPGFPVNFSEQTRPVLRPGATDGATGSAGIPVSGENAGVGSNPRTEAPPSGESGRLSEPAGAGRASIGNTGTVVSGEVSESGTDILQPSGAPISSSPGISFHGPASPGSSAGKGALSLDEQLEGATSTSGGIEDPILERLVSTGEELRVAGNMQGALQALREAEAALAENPRVLSGLAATYGKMSLEDKATLYWEKVLALGEAGAGAYYGVAHRQIHGEPESAPLAAGNGVVMKIAKIDVDEEAPSESGEQRVSLRIVVESDPAGRPDGEDLAVLVFFYDVVGGSRIDASTADTSYLYPTEPYNWQSNGTEEIVVNYSQPEFSEEQKLELGERKYYGYVIELYYQDKLQDRVVMPEDIAEVQIERGSPPPAGGQIAPENALFPQSP
jgi:hypothetical protein